MFKTNGDVTIKAGYVFTVNTWENDLDASKTESLRFNTLEEAKMFASICEKYASQNGNRYVEWGGDGFTFDIKVFTDEELNYIFKELFRDAECEAQIESLKSGGEDALDDFMDGLNDRMYDVGITGSEHYAGRVIDGWAIHEIKETVKFERVANGGRFSYSE